MSVTTNDLFTIFESPCDGGVIAVFRGQFADECRVCGAHVRKFGHPIIWQPRICSDCCDWAQGWIPYVTATYDGTGEFCGDGPGRGGAR